MMNVVDPIVSEPAAGPPQAEACLNCGAPLGGPFCSNCGQRAKLNRTLSSFLADFVAGMVNFEGRLWQTLPMLAWCPGDLTRRYVEGQRARFVSPAGLYLFTVFLMFAVLGFSGALDGLTINNDIGQVIGTERRELVKLEQEREAVRRQGQNLAAINRKIQNKQADIKQLEEVQSGNIIQADVGDEQNSPAWLRDAVKRAAADPRETIARVQDAASKYSWLLIPLSVPVLRLLFPLRRRRLYDHTVFVTYSLSFMMFLVIAGSLLVLVGASGWVSFLALVPPVHMYRQLKGAYALRWWDAVLRTFVLLVAAITVLILWFTAITALGVLE
jgi:hypothetical protein